MAQVVSLLFSLLRNQCSIHKNKNCKLFVKRIDTHALNKHFIYWRFFTAICTHVVDIFFFHF